jgi:two-component system response regulator RpfG
MPNVVNLNTESVSSSLFAIASKKVLVIDDQKSARVIMEGVIRCIDPYIEVKPFSNPLEAIEWARANLPDLILTDYKMREIDGIETIKRLRQLPTCADVPIVMVTVSVDAKVCHAAFDAGVTDFLVKPYDHYECRARCRNLLTMREQQLVLTDRAKLLEVEIAAAVRQMRARERETIMFSANLSEYHAHQNGFRLVRIARYARLIATGMELPPDMAERIELASTLRDVGKIGIPDDILLAQGALTTAQEEVLRGHTEIGHRLLEHSSSDYLQMAAEISLHHHERYDGCGYPKGAKGREIPLAARIVAVAEAFDELTSASNRDGAEEIAAAMRSIMSRKGTEFDPVCVEALASQLDTVGAVIATSADPA